MKKLLLPFGVLAMLCAGMYSSCTKATDVAGETELSQDIKDAIFRLGFTSDGAYASDGGYIVEGDIFLTDADLQATPDYMFLRVGDVEQYRTNNLVTGLPRTITVSVSSQLNSAISSATNTAIARFNAENLQLTFTRVNSGGMIQLVRGNGQYLASAGFPSGGNPYGQVKINQNQLSGQPSGTIASVIAHELGHCIGFRHTDYMDRSYSCGGTATNEGASTVGAIHIPGTPTTADAGSWMLACVGSGEDRPFNANDQTALDYLY